MGGPAPTPAPADSMHECGAQMTSRVTAPDPSLGLRPPPS